VDGAGGVAEPVDDDLIDKFATVGAMKLPYRDADAL
jgi:hypothetical protein